MHDELVVTTDWSTLAGPSTGFPVPPLPGTAAIVALDHPRLIVEEGEQQRNCAGSYVARVRRGGLYIYRVLEPSRATLSILKRDGRWRVDQLEGPRSSPVPPETRKAVLVWLRDAQVGLPERRRVAQRGLWTDEQLPD